MERQIDSRYVYIFNGELFRNGKIDRQIDMFIYLTEKQIEMERQIDSRYVYIFNGKIDKNGKIDRQQICLYI